MQACVGQNFGFTYQDGIVHFEASGLWTPEITAAVHREMNPFYNDLRARGLPVRVIADLSKLPPQPREISGELDHNVQLAHRPEDRVALVVASSVTRLQLRRIVRTPQLEMFTSVADARAWLRAQDRPATAA